MINTELCDDKSCCLELSPQEGALDADISRRISVNAI